MSTAIEAIAAAIAGIAPPLLDGERNRMSACKEIEHHDFYYLHRINHVKQ